MKKRFLNISQIKRKIVFAYIFGSFVNKDKYHDIDVAVFLKKDFNKFNNAMFPYGYESEFISNLTILTKKKIDFIVINNAEITIQQRIVNNGICLFSKDELKRINYENIFADFILMQKILEKLKEDT